jgi:hypothetical protein
VTIHGQFRRCSNDRRFLDLRERKIPRGTNLVRCVVPIPVRLAFRAQRCRRFVERATLKSTEEEITLNPIAGGTT